MKITKKRLREVVSKFLSEETHAFHGFKFGPGMIGLPGPEFDDEQRVTEEDIDDAEMWLNMYDPTELVAFSRGSAVLHQALQDNPSLYQEVPPVTYISPAALRQWTDAGVPPVPAGSRVIHSIGDNIVPLKQGCQVAAQAGIPMIATPGKGDGKDHVRALKYRTKPGGVEIDAAACVVDPLLPDWGRTNYASPEELEQQMQIGARYMTGNDIRSAIATDRMLEALMHEVTTLSRSVTHGFAEAMMRSRFWTHPHGTDDVDLVTDTELSTPAIEVLMDALNNESESQNSDLYFLLTVTGDSRYELGPGDDVGGYPDNWMMQGQYQGPQAGKHVIWLEFRPLAQSYNLSDLNPNELVKKISRTINHEIVHYEQLKKQSLSKGIDDEKAWEELLADPRQYSRSGKRADYLSRHIEIDAFAHEAAEEMLDMYSPEEALNQLRLAKPSSPGILKDYITVLSARKEDLHNFMSKVYTHIKMNSEQTS